jgi:TetR/AcrR family tetracycline transcriptional repressor
VLSTGALSLMERLLGTLNDAGVPTQHLGVAADTLLSHITGFVLQEQGESLTPEIDAQAVAELHERSPMVLGHVAGHDQDEKFIRSVRLLCAGVQTLILS